MCMRMYHNTDYKSVFVCGGLIKHEPSMVEQISKLLASQAQLYSSRPIQLVNHMTSRLGVIKRHAMKSINHWWYTDLVK